MLIVILKSPQMYMFPFFLSTGTIGAAERENFTRDSIP